MAVHFTTETSDSTSPEEAVDGTITVHAEGTFAGARLTVLVASTSGIFSPMATPREIRGPISFNLVLAGRVKFQLTGSTSSTSISVNTEAIS